MAIRVTFSEPMFGDDLENAAAWTLESLDGFAATILSVVAADDNLSVRIETDPMPPGGGYVVTAPYTLEDGAGNLIDPTECSARFASGGWDELSDEEGLLEALTGAVGAMLADVHDRPRTRLSRPLAPGDGTVFVESAHKFRDSGVLLIQGERITYSERWFGAFGGIVREPYVTNPDDGSDVLLRFDTYPVGTEVIAELGDLALTDAARTEGVIETAIGRDLSELGQDLGFPRPLSVIPDGDYQQYLRVRNYLDAQTFWAVFRVLFWMFRWANLRGADGERVDASTIDSVSIPNTRQLAGRWLLVKRTWDFADVPDTDLLSRSSICRIRRSSSLQVGNAQRIELEANDGPFWTAPGLPDEATGIEWELLPFTIWDAGDGECYRESRPSAPRTVYVRLYYGALPPTTYMLSFETCPTPADGRPFGGILLSPDDQTWPNPPFRPEGFGNPIYLLNQYEIETRVALRDVIAAGIRLKFTSLYTNPA